MQAVFKINRKLVDEYYRENVGELGLVADEIEYILDSLGDYSISLNSLKVAFFNAGAEYKLPSTDIITSRVNELNGKNFNNTEDAIRFILSKFKEQGLELIKLTF